VDTKVDTTDADSDGEDLEPERFVKTRKGSAEGESVTGTDRVPLLSLLEPRKFALRTSARDRVPLPRYYD